MDRSDVLLKKRGGRNAGSAGTAEASAAVDGRGQEGSGLVGAVAGTGTGGRQYQARLTGNQRRAAKRQRRRDEQAREG